MAKRAEPFKGQTFAFFGGFSVWPSYHGASPAEVAKRRGAIVSDTLDESVDRLVLGDLRGTGRSEAKKKGERLAKTRKGFRILDEVAYRQLVRLELKGKTFSFTGTFDCSPVGLQDGLLAGMVQAVGGIVQADVDESLDYLVVGNHRGPSKIATQNKAKKLREDGAELQILDETGFLELIRLDKPAKVAGTLDFPAFMARLYGVLDEGKLGRALDMLQHESFKLYSRLDTAQLIGVVRSQSRPDHVYACWLAPEGKYGCCQVDLEDCMGLQGRPCKHLMVLVVGLVRAGQMPMDTAMEWMTFAGRKGPKRDADRCADALLQYKGAMAGEIDWRPTETVPEDFYAL